MSFLLMEQVWTIPLPMAEKLVLLKLAWQAADDGTGSRPGIPLLMATTNGSERAIRVALRGLENSGFIRPVSGSGGGRGRGTEYLVTLPKGAAGAPFPPQKGAYS